MVTPLFAPVGGCSHYAFMLQVMASAEHDRPE